MPCIMYVCMYVCMYTANAFVCNNGIIYKRSLYSMHKRGWKERIVQTRWVLRRKMSKKTISPSSPSFIPTRLMEKLLCRYVYEWQKDVFFHFSFKFSIMTLAVIAWIKCTFDLNKYSFDDIERYIKISWYNGYRLICDRFGSK